MKYLIILLAILMIGCSKTPKVEQDPCEKTKICWGNAGTQPSDVEECRKVVECHDWILGAQ